MDSTYEYDVAISFAGEDRPKAEALAAALKARDINVFYDEYEKVSLWGKDLYSHLSDIYQKHARYCVMLLSDNYAKKVWTNHERKSAQARAFNEYDEYILPVRLDNTDIPGILPTTGYLRWPPENEETLADALKKKLNAPKLIELSESISRKTIGIQHDERHQFLAIEALDGTVYFGEDKYDDNGNFRVESRFHILVGEEPITLLGIDGIYYAYGCPSLKAPSRNLIIGSGHVPLDIEGEISPHSRLLARSRTRICYSHIFLPPLMNTRPVDCDNGDLRITLSWRTDSQLKTQATEFVFQFTDTGHREMKLSESLRPPPRLTDDELRAWCAEGRITQQDIDDLLAIDPIERYMVAFSNNDSAWCSKSAFQYLPLLRELVGNPHNPKL